MIANDDATACVRIARPPERQPAPRAPDCSARGPRFINNPNNPAICIRCPPGMIANGDADACVRFGASARLRAAGRLWSAAGLDQAAPALSRLPRASAGAFPARTGSGPVHCNPADPAVAPRTF